MANIIEEDRIAPDTSPRSLLTGDEYRAAVLAIEQGTTFIDVPALFTDPHEQGEIETGWYTFSEATGDSTRELCSAMPERIVLIHISDSRRDLLEIFSLTEQGRILEKNHAVSVRKPAGSALRAFELVHDNPPYVIGDFNMADFPQTISLHSLEDSPDTNENLSRHLRAFMKLSPWEGSVTPVPNDAQQASVIFLGVPSMTHPNQIAS